MLAELTASTPPNRTVTSSTDSTGWSAWSLGVASTALTDDAGKAGLLDLGDGVVRLHGRRRARSTALRERRAKALACLGDLPPEPVGVATETDGGQAGGEVGKLRQLRDVRLQGREDGDG